MLGKVEAVADDELVGALEADIAARDVGLGRRVLAHERRHRKRRRLARDCRFFRRYFSVSPESMMSSAMTTWRPRMSVLRSFQDAHPPELFARCRRRTRP